MEIPHEINTQIEDITNDKISGASTIAKNAAECLDKFATWVMENANDLENDQYIQQLIILGQKLVSAQPAMAPVLNAVNLIITSTNEKYNNINNELQDSDSKKQVKYLCTATQATSRKFILENKLALESIANQFNEIIDNQAKIMTISASSAVEALLNQAYINSVEFTVITPESRPMFEGRLLAERLAKLGIETTLIVDSAMFHFLKECTVVIVGADRVSPAGVVNKIGTYGLAIAANELKIPVYCVCERTKFLPDILPFDKTIVDHPEDQIYEPKEGKKKPDKLSIENIYFDLTSMEYITQFMTEDGMMTNSEVKNYMNNIEILPELVSGLNLE